MTHSNSRGPTDPHAPDAYDPIEAVELENDMIDAIEFSSPSMPISNPERLLKRAIAVMGKMAMRIEELDEYYRP